MSATPALSDLDPLLASLNELKAPGANKSKIASITSICVKNIQAEQSIVQSFYRALKKAPATHKLGALYVIDSVIRQWTDKAKKAGQELHLEGSGRGEPGTYSAALKRVAELMPALLDDTLKVIPADQKPKLQNLVDIWDRGNFFPSKIVAELKQKLAEAVPQSLPANGGAAKFRPAIPTRPVQTPVGLPPQHLYDRGFLVARDAGPQNTLRSPATQQPAQPPADVNNILAALAASAPKPQSLPPPQVAVLPPAVSAPAAIPADFMAMLAQQAAPVQSLPPQFGLPPASAPPFNPVAFQPPASFPAFPPQVAAPPQFVQPPAPAQDPLGPLRGLLPANILNDREKLMQALNLLQELQSGGVPMDQWVPVIQAFSEKTEQQAGPPQTTYNSRGRSRSPDRRGNGRGSPVYGNYDESQRQAQSDAHERARYRQRTPTRNSPAGSGLAMNGNPMQPKVIIIDPDLPKDNIKVLSRTLFVGGANGSQQEIHTLFERFGRVQTCIANRDKRHAFVKMTTRQFALNAKAGMEQMQQQNDREVMNIARQTKWGVGFGPRECCDYQRGESVIPIHKLTDADVKWLLSAEYGGTGGQELHGGMVLEEPDIEIGAGVSSKAMSKRVAPDGTQLNRQGKDRGGRRHNDRDRAPRGGGRGGDDVQMGGMPMEAYGYARPEPVAVATPPAVPGFGFTLPGR
ncbi:hypothetical protein AMS68_007118 [Peltaster fructicola]|uniref:CID domain-containing protein n=1 Tax=Peltaster fructicola TaxID=286661 RepID=A0A6H0Y3V6_9PEZI|nr:hypothetical protein AMS68_007118 [Peltaster fructicola]